MEPVRILILGVTGMLGHKLFLQLSSYENLQVFATARNPGDWVKTFPGELADKMRWGVDADEFDTVVGAIGEVKPDLVINCMGIIKQGVLGQDYLANISLNALTPHKLARACEQTGSRLLHISTDCVFRGDKGGYIESDIPDALDLYGRSKALGEVDYRHCLTLRTSIIGHELKSHLGLIEWFLAQKNQIYGYTHHIYTGFPTVELARIIACHIIPNPWLHGLYHLSSEPISKYELLKLVALTYNKAIEIVPDDETICDRSLDCAKLRNLIKYVPPTWPEMIEHMYKDFLATPYSQSITK
ncbi:MAG TPA: SDR family oxidoreductase [Syntrophomonadaceae bacterium]|nr:SDR family oxidoreductase [Syntrophomonadaceae bacterium]